ncbi:MAG: HD domain-containing protein [Alphaproteobacteria bacterium]|nr:HD domain-containing protein [Alphaproteobacteria bacterium]
MAVDPQLVLIDDNNPASAALWKALNAGFSVIRFNGGGVEPSAVGMVKAAVVCLNNAALERYAVDNGALGLSTSNTVFVLPTHNAESVDRLVQRGVRDYFVAPVAEADLWAAIQKAVNRGVESSWETLAPVMRDALVASRSTLSACFDLARKGEPLDLADVNQACGLINDALPNLGIADWLSTIRAHHDYTYRHSMFVCGAITQFGRAIGATDNDIHILTAGGVLHDIGKSHVPQCILDKPTKLDEAEWVVMGQHPSHSREILFRESGLDPRIVAMAVHHHEKLDGTGYPDGLSGHQITDHIRLMSIADVFSALVDERAYKPAMSPEAALNRMETFKGHLDLDLLKAFKEFVMDHDVGGEAPAEVA